MFPWCIWFSGEISNLSHSIVFLYFFALITEEGFLLSPCYSLNSTFKWVYLSFSPLPFTSLLFSAICKHSSSDKHFAFDKEVSRPKAEGIYNLGNKQWRTLIASRKKKVSVKHWTMDFEQVNAEPHDNGFWAGELRNINVRKVNLAWIIGEYRGEAMARILEWWGKRIN